MDTTEETQPNPNPNMNPVDVKAAAKVLMSKLGSYGHALDQNRKYRSMASQDWQTKTGRDLSQQWDTLKHAMEELGF